MARSRDPNSIAGFVRSFPSSASTTDILAKAKEKGLKVDAKYVSSLRSRLKGAQGNGRAATASRPAGQRSAPTQRAASPDGLTAAIERIVEERVKAILAERLGALFNR